MSGGISSCGQIRGRNIVCQKMFPESQEGVHTRQMDKTQLMLGFSSLFEASYSNRA